MNVILKTEDNCPQKKQLSVLLTYLSHVPVVCSGDSTARLRGWCGLRSCSSFRVCPETVNTGADCEGVFPWGGHLSSRNWTETHQFIPHTPRNSCQIIIFSDCWPAPIHTSKIEVKTFVSGNQANEQARPLKMIVLQPDWNIAERTLRSSYIISKIFFMPHK